MTTYKNLIDRDELWFLIKMNFDDDVVNAVAECLRYCKTYQLKSIDSQADQEKGVDSIEEGFE